MFVKFMLAGEKELRPVSIVASKVVAVFPLKDGSIAIDVGGGDTCEYHVVGKLEEVLQAITRVASELPQDIPIKPENWVLISPGVNASPVTKESVTAPSADSLFPHDTPCMCEECKGTLYEHFKAWHKALVGASSTFPACPKPFEYPVPHPKDCACTDCLTVQEWQPGDINDPNASDYR